MSRKKKRKKQYIARFEEGELDFLIKREFPEKYIEVKNKFSGLKYYGLSPERTMAAILKLADRDFDKIKGLIKDANTDPRDVITYAEYPISSKLSWTEEKNMTEEEKEEMNEKQWQQYQEWKNKGK